MAPKGVQNAAKEGPKVSKMSPRDRKRGHVLDSAGTPKKTTHKKVKYMDRWDTKVSQRMPEGLNKVQKSTRSRPKGSEESILRLIRFTRPLRKPTGQAVRGQTLLETQASSTRLAFARLSKFSDMCAMLCMSHTVIAFVAET